MFDSIYDAYFRWLVSQVGSQVMYNSLLRLLHMTAFHYIMPMDRNRFDDGLYLRHRFANAANLPSKTVDITKAPCSILEMMVALAARCEDNIMADDEIGNRTGVWFWEMIDSLGLSVYTDSQIELEGAEPVLDILRRFNLRAYEPDGRGGLFRTDRKDIDMRSLEIWDQAMMHFNEVAKQEE